MTGDIFIFFCAPLGREGAAYGVRDHIQGMAFELYFVRTDYTGERKIGYLSGQKSCIDIKYQIIGQA